MHNIQQPVIETDRLLLKELNDDIVKQALACYKDEELMELFGITTQEELNAEKNNHRLGMSSYRMSWKKFVIIEKATGKCIGKCGFHNWYAMHSRSEMGYAMDSEYGKRRGYMTEAVQALIAFGFAHMELNRIEAYVGRHNVPSLKIIQGSGFTQEGILRQHFCKNGIIEDSLCFGLLRSEYEAKKTNNNSI